MCQCDLTTSPFYLKMDISTGMNTTPRMVGGHNYEMCWVGGSNTFPIKTEKSIQVWRPNDFCSASAITKNCMDGIPDDNVKLKESLWSNIIIKFKINTNHGLCVCSAFLLTKSIC